MKDIISVENLILPLLVLLALNFKEIGSLV